MVSQSIILGTDSYGPPRITPSSNTESIDLQKSESKMDLERLLHTSSISAPRQSGNVWSYLVKGNDCVTMMSFRTKIAVGK